MKKLGFFKFVALIALAPLAFTSCSDDDNPNPDPNPGQSGQVDANTVFTQGIPSQVGNLIITKNEKGLVTQIKDLNKVINFNYSGSKKSRSEAINIPKDYDMVMNVDWDSDDDNTCFYIKLNSNGFIEYAYEIENDSEDGISVDEWWFKYNANHQLAEMRRSEGDNEITTIKYNADGDIIEVNVTDDTDGDYNHITIGYTDETHATPIVNKSGIMMYDDCFRIDVDEMDYAYFAGLLGKGTTHLPLSAIEEIIEPDYTGTDTYAFEWILNSSDMPIRFISVMTNDKGYTETEDEDFKW